MKQKGIIVLYAAIALVLVHLILVVGCGKNPLISMLTGGVSGSGSFTFGIARL